MYNSAENPSPPVNNLLQPNIYNRLDAEVIERTRVVNTQLDERLRAQHRLLAKYRLAAERYHRREKERVKNELMNITDKLPAVSRIRNFRSKFLYGRDGLSKSPSESLPDLRVKKIRGIPEERCSMPFCERFFIHHLPSKKKYYKIRTPTPPPALTAREGEEGGGVVTDQGGVEVPTLIVTEAEAARSDNAIDVVQLSNAVPSPNGFLGPDSAFDADNLSPYTDNLEPTSGNAGNAGRSSPKESLGVKNGKRSPHHSAGKGRQPDRKSPRRRAGRTFLPPIEKQDLGLSRSSPQLFQG